MKSLTSVNTHPAIWRFNIIMNYARPNKMHFRGLTIWCPAVFLACAMAGQVLAQSNAPLSLSTNAATPAALGVSKEAPGSSALKSDPAAAKFMTLCAGCHSLSGAKLTGPELSHVAGWSLEAIKTSTKRMEKNVGPLTESDLATFAELLHDTKARDRLKSEEARIQAQFMAKMEPPSAAIGRQLFLGATPLANGGLACSACHSAASENGNLGPDLTGIFAKMGQTPLVSAIEKPAYKLMAPHYRDHPVTKQEAMHLAQYFSTLDPQNVLKAGTPFVPLGAGAAAAMLISIGFYFRSKRSGRQTKLQRRRQTT